MAEPDRNMWEAKQDAAPSNVGKEEIGIRCILTYMEPGEGKQIASIFCQSLAGEK